MNLCTSFLVTCVLAYIQLVMSSLDAAVSHRVVRLPKKACGTPTLRGRSKPARLQRACRYFMVWPPPVQDNGFVGALRASLWLAN